MKYSKITLLLFFLSYILILVSCKKNEEEKNSPFDSILCDGDNSIIRRVFPDGSFLLLHRYGNYHSSDGNIKWNTIMYENVSSTFESKWKYYSNGSAILSPEFNGIVRYNDGSIGIIGKEHNSQSNSIIYMRISINGIVLEDKKIENISFSTSGYYRSNFNLINESFYLCRNDFKYIHKFSKEGNKLDSINIESYKLDVWGFINLFAFNDKLFLVRENKVNENDLNVIEIDIDTGNEIKSLTLNGFNYIQLGDNKFYALDSNKNIYSINSYLDVSNYCDFGTYSNSLKWGYFDGTTYLNNDVIYYFESNENNSYPYCNLKYLDLESKSINSINLFELDSLEDMGPINDIRVSNNKIYLSIDAFLRSNSGFLKYINYRPENKGAILIIDKP